MVQNRSRYEEPILEVLYLYNVADTLTGDSQGEIGEDDFENLGL